MNASKATLSLISNLGTSFGVSKTVSNIGGNENYSIGFKRAPRSLTEVASKINQAAQVSGFAPGTGMFPFVADTTNPTFYVEKKGKNGGEVVSITLKGSDSAPSLFIEPCGVLANSII